MQVQDLFNVKGKVVLVTGGGRGVGEMVSLPAPSAISLYPKADNALDCLRIRCEWSKGKLIPLFSWRSSFTRNIEKEKCSEADYDQVYISSRDAKACNETASRLTKAGPGECIAIPGDLAKFDECVKLVKELEKREKALHVLVCSSPL